MRRPVLAVLPSSSTVRDILLIAIWCGTHACLVSCRKEGIPTWTTRLFSVTWFEDLARRRNLLSGDGRRSSSLSSTHNPRDGQTPPRLLDDYTPLRCTLEKPRVTIDSWRSVLGYMNYGADPKCDDYGHHAFGAAVVRVTVGPHGKNCLRYGSGLYSEIS